MQTLVHCQQLVELLTDTRRHKSLTQQSREIELVGDDGSPRWYRVTARNIPTRPEDSDPDGTSQGAVALLHDISAQRLLQKRNAEFVSAVSHEMKTPLAGIKAYVELLADGEAEDERSQREFLRVVGLEVDRLEGLVDDLVELARIEADLSGTRRSPCAMRLLVEEALDAVRTEAAEKQIALTAELNADASIDVDRQLILQAVIHVLSNAVKYTAGGGHVTVRSWQSGATIGVDVQDTGVGLSSEDCQRIFEKFYRVPAHRGMAGGAGLGLSLVKHIVENVHGGSIEVESVPGQGSLFRISLPVAANAP